MSNVIGIDSRVFLRDVVKKDGTEGHFRSVLGIAIKVKKYQVFQRKYADAINIAFEQIGLEPDFQYYCVNDLKTIKSSTKLLDAFSQEISDHIEKVHVFYTLFSKKSIKEAKVYGRFARLKKIKLSAPTRSYEKLVTEHLTQCFPGICAWRLMQYFNPQTLEFHLDYYGGHISEAQEELDASDYRKILFPHGDCSNPVISTADLLLDVLDKRLKRKRKHLLFDNIRPALTEFGDNVLVYPILNKHLRKIVPIDKIPIDTLPSIQHPVFWVFKGDELIDSGTMKRSKTYRNLIDYAASCGGVVKMFEKGKDIKFVTKGDYGAYINVQGREIIESYIKMGKPLKLLDIDCMVPKEHKNI